MQAACAHDGQETQNSKHVCKVIKRTVLVNNIVMELVTRCVSNGLQEKMKSCKSRE